VAATFATALLAPAAAETQRWKRKLAAGREALRIGFAADPNPQRLLKRQSQLADRVVAAEGDADLFLPAAARGTLVFLHGGYWRALDKSDFSFVAPPFLAHDLAVAVVNYDLCPDVTIATIVDECRRALAWVARDGRALGTNAERIVVAGHSAGGHLTAMMYATDWGALGRDGLQIAGGVSLSGVHDLEPLLMYSFNSDLRLDAAQAARLSPTRLRPRVGAPLLLAVGADGPPNSSGRRSSCGCVARNPARWRPRAVRHPQRHHFDVVSDYGNSRADRPADAGAVLTQARAALFILGSRAFIPKFLTADRRSLSLSIK
jgi:arylformamidase